MILRVWRDYGGGYRARKMCPTRLVKSCGCETSALSEQPELDTLSAVGRLLGGRRELR